MMLEIYSVFGHLDPSGRGAKASKPSDNSKVG